MAYAPQSIKPGETNTDKKAVLMELFTSDGLWASGGADANYETAFPTFAAGDLKLSYDMGASYANATIGNFVQAGKQARYTFANGEVDTSHTTAGLGGGVPEAILLKFEKALYRTQIIAIPFRSEIRAASWDDSDAVSAGATTEIQAGIATATALADAETAILAATDALAAELIAIGGLLHRNAMIDGGSGQLGPSYDANGNLLTGRVRVFADQADLAAATLGAADDADGEVYRYTLTGTVASQKMASFKARQVL